MMSSVSVAVIVPRNSESEMQPEMDSHGSRHEKHLSVSGRYLVMVSWRKCAVGCLVMGATMSAASAVPAEEACEMRPVFIPTCLATFTKVSPLWRNSDVRRLTIGADRWLLPVEVCVISTLPLWSRMFWLFSSLSRSAFIFL